MSSANQSHGGFALATFVAAGTAALASALSLAFSLPVWTMFVGWIAFFTRIHATRTALENLGAVLVGMLIGALAASVIPQIAPIVGPGIALPIVVFVVALAVVALRGLPVMNNLLGYFLGLVAWFAAHLEPSPESIVHLFGASAIGSLAGWLSHNLPARLARRGAGA